MGRIARTFAHVKNVTVDPIVVSGKFVGRKSKAGALVVAHKVHEGVEAVRVEEARIEATKEVKAQAKAKVEDLADAAVVAKAEKSKAKKAKAATA
jgi:predicted nucleic acid-binding protein